MLLTIDLISTIAKMRTQSITVQEFRILRVSVRDLIRTQSMQMNSLSRIVMCLDMMPSREFRPLSNCIAESRSREILQEDNREKLMTG